MYSLHLPPTVCRAHQCTVYTCPRQTVGGHFRGLRIRGGLHTLSFNCDPFCLENLGGTFQTPLRPVQFRQPPLNLNAMIGIFETTHPTEGYSVTIRYRRADGRIKILGISTHGKDIWGSLSSSEIQILKSRIPYQ